MNNDESTATEDTVAANNKTRQMGPVAEGTTDGTTPPAKPTDSEGNELEMGTPPEMDCDASSEDCAVPEMPEMGGEFGGDFGGRPGEMTLTQTSSNELHPVAYLAIGGVSVILGILVSYICFSRFFHLRPGETFATKGRFIWFIVVALVLAVGGCALGYFIPVWIN